jgi:hypothetical protein
MARDDFRVVSADIAKVAATVRRIGSDRTIVKNMAKEMRRSATPLRKLIRANAIRTLPRRGGLNAWVAKSSITANVKRGPRTAGVTLVGSKSKGTGKRADLEAIDRGLVRVPQKGNREAPWRAQAVPPGFMTDVVNAHKDEFRQALVVAVDRAMRELRI